MKNLVPYEEKAIDAFDAIVEDKQKRLPKQRKEEGAAATVAESPTRKATLQALRAFVEERYEAYAAAVSDGLDTLQPYEGLDEHQRKALEHCYGVSTEALRSLTKAIRASQADRALDQCQYCCLGHPRTWDHYFPKSVFPEFSVYPPNMVPCCSDCNTIRKERWRTGEGRLVVHLYYDTIPAEEALLKAHIEIVSGLPKVTFSAVGGAATNPMLGRLFARHCDTLDLFERFAPEVRSLVTGLRDEAQDWSGEEGDVTRVFRNKAERKRRELGPSHWETAVLMAASESPEFIRYCLGDEPAQVEGAPAEQGELAGEPA